MLLTPSISPPPSFSTNIPSADLRLRQPLSPRAGSLKVLPTSSTLVSPTPSTNTLETHSNNPLETIRCPKVFLDTPHISHTMAGTLALSLLGQILYRKSQIPFPVVLLSRMPDGQSDSRTARRRTELLTAYDTLCSHLNTTFSALSTAFALSKTGEKKKTHDAHLVFVLGPSIGAAKQRVVFVVDGLEVKLQGGRDNTRQVLRGIENLQPRFPEDAPKYESSREEGGGEEEEPDAENEAHDDVSDDEAGEDEDEDEGEDAFDGDSFDGSDSETSEPPVSRSPSPSSSTPPAEPTARPSSSPAAQFRVYQPLAKNVSSTSATRSSSPSLPPPLSESVIWPAAFPQNTPHIRRPLAEHLPSPAAATQPKLQRAIGQTYAEEQRTLRAAERSLSQSIFKACSEDGGGLTCELDPMQTHILLRAPRRFFHPEWTPRQTMTRMMDGVLQTFVDEVSAPETSPTKGKAKMRRGVRTEGVWIGCRGSTAGSGMEWNGDETDKDEEDEMIWWEWKGKIMGFADK
ncbi:hypothetical protein SCP_0202450 [Sparassis crispa]|uniref:Uncharacterized protein n=1 Tax=Sparassis crispa TaxID=139825 RepID=A0A401GA56_9APHY|nr:hypothetical protein SCP_0202450 [Sparassis crispa]GBE79048.1 hypothetical protein SCP_0202450 [Sparassis crispa]